MSIRPRRPGLLRRGGGGLQALETTRFGFPATRQLREQRSNKDLQIQSTALAVQLKRLVALLQDGLVQLFSVTETERGAGRWRISQVKQRSTFTLQ